jgi:predicted SprT family Zn-dependent metalloprotease
MSNFKNSEVINLAITHLDKWGLYDWRVGIISTKRRLGSCDINNRCINISSNHIKYSDDDAIIDTILHEIAHALHYMHYVNTNRKDEFNSYVLKNGGWYRKVKFHGLEWKRFARKVGANPSSKTPADELRETIYKWRVVIIDDDNIKLTNSYCHRFISKLPTKMLIGRPDTIGKLFLVSKTDANKLENNNMNVMVYQIPNVPIPLQTFSKLNLVT